MRRKHFFKKQPLLLLDFHVFQRETNDSCMQVVMEYIGNGQVGAEAGEAAVALEAQINQNEAQIAILRHQIREREAAEYESNQPVARQFQKPKVAQT